MIFRYYPCEKTKITGMIERCKHTGLYSAKLLKGKNLSFIPCDGLQKEMQWALETYGWPYGCATYQL